MDVQCLQTSTADKQGHPTVTVWSVVQFCPFYTRAVTIPHIPTYYRHAGTIILVEAVPVL